MQIIPAWEIHVWCRQRNRDDSEKKSLNLGRSWRNANHQLLLKMIINCFEPESDFSGHNVERLRWFYRSCLPCSHVVITRPATCIRVKFHGATMLRASVCRAIPYREISVSPTTTEKTDNYFCAGSNEPLSWTKRNLWSTTAGYNWPPKFIDNL